MVKVGDKVRIRKDLEERRHYGANIVVDLMLPYGGKEATITYVSATGNIKIDIDRGCWCWTLEMLEPVTSSVTPDDFYHAIMDKEGSI